MAALARRRGVPAIFFTRSEDAAAKLRFHGIEHVLVTSDKDFESELGKLAAELGTTAVLTALAVSSPVALRQRFPCTPQSTSTDSWGCRTRHNSSFLIMAKNLVLKRFSNFASETVTDPQRLAAAITYPEGMTDDPPFHTRVGKEFAFDHIYAAMAYEATLARERSCSKSSDRIH